jgi:hypothetical protein
VTRALGPALFFGTLWIFGVIGICAGLYTWHVRSYDDPFDNEAWLAVLLFGLVTAFLTTLIGFVAEDVQRPVGLQLVPPAVLLALTVALAWLIPARQPYAGKVALDFEAAAAALYTAAIARACWRRRGGERIARARVRVRR